MVLCMENEILTALDYNLSGPTAYTFQDQRVKRAAHILAGASLYYYGFHRYLPSVVAASAIFLARLHILAQPWSKDLAELTGYKAIELMGCVCDMYSVMPNPRFALFQEARELPSSLLYYYGFHRYLPSFVAASAIFLARLHVLAQPWSKDLVELTGYKAIELMGCVCHMYSLMPNPRLALFQEYFFEDP
ncbi:hypothetical protein E2562_018810 [Oryza meyeriana var. granulata]|uniref:Cyclin C-terminal domain-containing protein n=1 Tax=Oryza meyeriana var. granulata TaxID=110450 RepID=A0A6G1F9P3_9ORYZ|nr:hypothetical protein E2562_018810 [Oryza meyeriana var. granulata]